MTTLEHNQLQQATIDHYWQTIQDKQAENPDKSLGSVVNDIILKEALHPDKQFGWHEKQQEQAKFNLECLRESQRLSQAPMTPKPTPNNISQPSQQPMDVNDVADNLRDAMVVYGSPTLEIGDGNDARQRFIEALKKEFDHANSFGLYNRSAYNNPGPGSNHHCGDGAVSYQDGTHKGEPCVFISVDPALYTTNGKMDAAKREELYIEAAAKFEIARAEAKYMDNPAKGLAELKDRQQIWGSWYGGHEKGSPEVARMDALTANKIESLLLAREKSLEKGTTAPQTTDTATPEKTSSSRVQKTLESIGHDQLQNDATTLQAQQGQAQESNAPSSPA